MTWTVTTSMQHWAKQPSSTFVNPGGEIVLACRINNKKMEVQYLSEYIPENMNGQEGPRWGIAPSE